TAPVPEGRFRLMPPGVRDRTYAQNREEYDAIQAAHPSGERVAVGASVLLISGCQDNQLSSDGDRNGLFTENLLAVWDKGRFRGGDRKFHKAIPDHMPPRQSPNYFPGGPPGHALPAPDPLHHPPEGGEGRGPAPSGPPARAAVG